MEVADIRSPQLHVIVSLPKKMKCMARERERAVHGNKFSAINKKKIKFCPERSRKSEKEMC
jgi:hypothetical protein